jgi:hypothetical protein
MDESFFIKVNGIVYEVIPEEEGTFTIFKFDAEYMQILRNRNKKWMRIDYKTDEPILEENKEVEDVGRLVDKYLERD